MDSMNNKYFPEGWNEIGFEVNNMRNLVFSQKAFDDFVTVATIGSDGVIEDSYKVSNAEMVMLWNLYVHIMKNNIRNDFINPYGKNADEEAEEANRKIIENRRKESAEELAEDAKVIKEMMTVLSEMISKYEKKISET